MCNQYQQEDPEQEVNALFPASLQPIVKYHFCIVNIIK